MAKKPTAKAKRAGAVAKAKPQALYHCRCYQIGDEYEMWILDPATGTYRGPIPYTREQCRACNMSKAEIVGQSK